MQFKLLQPMVSLLLRLLAMAMLTWTKPAAWIGLTGVFKIQVQSWWELELLAHGELHDPSLNSQHMVAALMSKPGDPVLLQLGHGMVLSFLRVLTTQETTLNILAVHLVPLLLWQVLQQHFKVLQRVSLAHRWSPFSFARCVLFVKSGCPTLIRSQAFASPIFVLTAFTRHRDPTNGKHITPHRTNA